MKSIFVIFSILALSGISSAATLVKYEFGKPLDQGQFHLYVVSVDDDGTAEIGKELVNEDSPDEPSAATLRTVVLSDEQMEVIEAEMALVETAEIEERLQHIVCAMMPPLGGHIDHLSVLNPDSGELRLVRGPQGCWVAYIVHPKGNPANDAAKRLQALLAELTEGI